MKKFTIRYITLCINGATETIAIVYEHIPRAGYSGFQVFSTEAEGMVIANEYLDVESLDAAKAEIDKLSTIRNRINLTNREYNLHTGEQV